MYTPFNTPMHINEIIFHGCLNKIIIHPYHVKHNHKLMNITNNLNSWCQLPVIGSREVAVLLH